MHWRKQNRRTLTRVWLGLILLLTGCTSSKEFFCPVETAYDATGTVDPRSYRVARDCYKSMNARQKACYAEAGR